MIAAIHANWPRGSAWPARDRKALADATFGGDDLPSATTTLLVAASLAFAGLMFLRPSEPTSKIRRVGARATATVFGPRPALGFFGLMAHDQTSAAFRRWNRRLYSPLCPVLAILCCTGSTGDA